MIKERVITFEEARYTIRDGGKVLVEATFKLDPSKKPKTFDLTITSEGDNKGKTQLGVYKIDGDTLMFCIAPFDGARPTEFASEKGSGRILTTYKRVKK